MKLFNANWEDGPNPITNHTDLLNALIEKYNLKSYLEIGVNNPANNFDLINIRDGAKVGIDPENKTDIRICTITSDDWFNDMYQLRDTMPQFNLIFIDGLHHADQVKRDFENSLRCLSDNGFIVIHDVLPENEEGTKVPRETKQWWGNVYQFAMKMDYEDVGFKTFNIDNGCMLVWKSKGSKQKTNPDLKMDWETYKKLGHSLMNVTSTVEI